MSVDRLKISSRANRRCKPTNSHVDDCQVHLEFTETVTVAFDELD